MEEIEKRAISALRVLAAEMVEKAKVDTLAWRWAPLRFYTASGRR